MKKYIALTLYASLLLVSCATNKYVFPYDAFDHLEKFTISQAIALETKRGAIDVTPTYSVTIGESIYPNEKKFKLASPKTYRKKEGSNFTIETDYHYSTTDSTVKVILYQWDYFRKKNDDFLDEKDTTTKFRKFQEKFDVLKASLSEKLGQPTEMNIEQNRSKTFRDDVKWVGKDGLNAYLFMFGNENAYRQIRLAIYND